ncbi:unnamed protein product [Lactuca virosa]|uniref:Amino acid transporter transmembrane domain-containing protein n=1 Tax=Lactuca virosa TaxID=75947 RepID=A0AAU9NRH4_9ASTR|nr:unnamed protein product [Lactuca virosa]
MLNLLTFPVAIGLYGYCYSRHAVFPNIYTSMEKRSQFPMVLLASFGSCVILYAAVTIMGYMMFGESTESQYTLNLPTNLIASKVVVWTTVVNPFTKYVLTISPIAMSLEELIPSNHMKSHVYSILIRTSLVFSIVLVALSIPFFDWSVYTQDKTKYTPRPREDIWSATTRQNNSNSGGPFDIPNSPPVKHSSMTLRNLILSPMKKLQLSRTQPQLFTL